VHGDGPHEHAIEIKDDGFRSGPTGMSRRLHEQDISDRGALGVKERSAVRAARPLLLFRLCFG
jgi:hypothetical protein